MLPVILRPSSCSHSSIRRLDVVAEAALTFSIFGAENFQFRLAGFDDLLRRRMLVSKRNELQLYSWVHAGYQGRKSRQVVDRSFVGWAMKSVFFRVAHLSPVTSPRGRAGDTRIFDGLT
jgi:hypothetical protein